MQLSQLKIRGLPAIPDTGWITFKPRLSIIRISGEGPVRRLVPAIQTINPPYDCLEQRPFHGIPTETITDSGHRKRIIPSRKTIALAVFNAAPSLVKELGALSETLYETDRIEVGRRLDYSLWVNFVELASSTRWSEVSEAIVNLADYASGLDMADQAVEQIIAGMLPTDRIKGESMHIVDQWLTRLRRDHPSPEHIDSIAAQVKRAVYFAEARQVVQQRMPLFLTPELPVSTAAAILEKEEPERGRFPPVYLMNLLDEPIETVQKRLSSWASAPSRNQTICFLNSRCPLDQSLTPYVISEIQANTASEPVSRIAR